MAANPAGTALGISGHIIHYQHGGGHYEIYASPLTLEKLELRHRNDDGKTVDKAVYSRQRNETDESPQSQQTERYLDESSYDCGENDILQDPRRQLLPLHSGTL